MTRQFFKPRRIGLLLALIMVGSTSTPPPAFCKCRCICYDKNNNITHDFGSKSLSLTAFGCGFRCFPFADPYHSDHATCWPWGDGGGPITVRQDDLKSHPEAQNEETTE